MARHARSAATYEDVLAAPPDHVAELMGGELHVQPRPSAPHAVATSLLGGMLTQAYWRGVGGPGGWILLDEPELHLAGDVLVPDMGGWLADGAIQGELQAAHFETPPRWVLEVLSPSTASKDRVLKLPRYLAAGVGHAWLLDPETRILEIFRSRQGVWELAGGYADRAVVRAEPFDAIEIELAELWVGEAPRR
jgi:Uma2 family endonuclease